LIGNVVFGPGVEQPFFDAVENYAINGTQDVQSAVIPLVQFGAGLGIDAPIYTSIIFNSAAGSTTPLGLSAFQNNPALPALSSTVTRRSLFNWTTELDPQFSQLSGFRNRFFVDSIIASRDAMTLIHDTFFASAVEVLGQFPDAVVGVAFMPLGKVCMSKFLLLHTLLIHSA
jgi:hypothetical protein